MSVSVGCGAARRRGRVEKLVARVRYRRDAGRQQNAQRVQLGQRGGLRAVQRVHDDRPEAAGFEIDQVRHVPGGDPQSQRIATQRAAVQKLRPGPGGGHCGELVDRHARRGHGPQRGHQHGRGIGSLAGRRLRLAALGDEVEHAGIAPSVGKRQIVAAIVIRLRLGELFGGARPRQPKGHVRPGNRSAAGLDPSLDAIRGGGRDRHEGERNGESR